MLITRLISLVPCLVIVQFVDIENANVVLNIVQFVQLPFVLIPAIRFISNKELVDTQVYQGIQLYLLLGFSGFLILMNYYQLSSNLPDSHFGKMIFFAGLILYTAFLVYIARCPLKNIPRTLRETANGSSMRSDSNAC